VAAAPGDALKWSGDVLVVAVAEDDLEVKGARAPPFSFIKPAQGDGVGGSRRRGPQRADRGAAVLSLPPDAYPNPPPPTPSLLDDVAAISSPVLADLDASLSGVISELLAAGGFEGKQGQATRPVRVLGAAAANVALAGVGKREKAVAVAEWGPSPYQVRGSWGRGRGWLAGVPRAAGVGGREKRRRVGREPLPGRPGACRRSARAPW
jgi:hypothetical protein